jgi:ferredoxin-type protein NapH
MKIAQKIGLTLFLLGLATFIASLSFNSYTLTDEILTEKISGGEKRDLFVENFPKLGETYTSKFAFISDVGAAYEGANATLLAKYAITEDEQGKLKTALGGKWTEEAVRSAFAQDEVGQGKAQKIVESSNWMGDKEYGSADELWGDLKTKVDEVNASAGSSTGFDSGTIKSGKFSLTKASSGGLLSDNLLLIFILSFVLGSVGALVYIFPQIWEGPAGIKNNGVFKNPATNAGWIGIIVGSGLIAFYIVLYWFPEYLTNWVLMVDPISKMLSGGEASQWFLYGFLYCTAMVVMGIRMFVKYRGNKYQMVRTASVIFFQLGFAFLLPEIMSGMYGGWAWVDFKNMWPLDYDFFFNGGSGGLLEYQEGGGVNVAGGSLGMFILIWGIGLFVIGVPLMVYFFGKRWYCSWVCGCGGLAETLGDPYRQLSDKGVKSWKIERWLINGVMIFAVLMTGITLYTMYTGQWSLWGIETGTIQKTYGFLIGSAFAGVVGTGFYPLMGNRMWCRFGCPLAAYLGIVQRFKSKFRITTNGGQCISCGNCSTYCEMGIDVRWYAQRGQNIVRSSCVGCGVCSAVCPRGVLKLENGPEEGRINDDPILIGSDGIMLNPDRLAPEPEQIEVLVKEGN